MTHILLQGNLSTAELRALLTVQTGSTLREEDILKVIRTVDQDGDGFISFFDFKKGVLSGIISLK
jgi:Ca2+-binding EF-hand superfamily protein